MVRERERRWGGGEIERNKDGESDKEGEGDREGDRERETGGGGGRI